MQWKEKDFVSLHNINTKIFVLNAQKMLLDFASNRQHIKGAIQNLLH